MDEERKRGKGHKGTGKVAAGSEASGEGGQICANEGKGNKGGAATSVDKHVTVRAPAAAPELEGVAW